MANSFTRYVWHYGQSFMDPEYSPYTFDLDGFDREDVGVVALWEYDPYVWDHFKELVGE